jgi:hypothetical protein
MCHTCVALPFTFSSMFWRQNKNYGNSNIISPCKKNHLQNKSSLKRNQNPSRYYYNSIVTHLKFQHKPKYHLWPLRFPKMPSSIEAGISARYFFWG